MLASCVINTRKTQYSRVGMFQPGLLLLLLSLKMIIWHALGCLNKYSAVQVAAELQLAALEAFTCACSALAETATQFFTTAAHASMKFESKTGAFLPDTPDKMADGLLNALVKNVEDSAFVGALGRSRRAILYGCKVSLRSNSIRLASKCCNFFLLCTNISHFLC